MAGTLLAGEDMTADLIGVPDWTAMVLLNSWVNASAPNVNAQYRQWKLLNAVEIIGTIQSGTLTSGTIVATLPFAPSSQQFMHAIVEASSGSAQVLTPMIFVDTSGNLKLQSVPSSTTTLCFHAWYSLDA